MGLAMVSFRKNSVSVLRGTLVSDRVGFSTSKSVFAVTTVKNWLKAVFDRFLPVKNVKNGEKKSLCLKHVHAVTSLLQQEFFSFLLDIH